MLIFFIIIIIQCHVFGSGSIISFVRERLDRLPSKSAGIRRTVISFYVTHFLLFVHYYSAYSNFVCFFFRLGLEFEFSTYTHTSDVDRKFRRPSESFIFIKIYRPKYISVVSAQNRKNEEKKISLDRGWIYDRTVYVCLWVSGRNFTK